MTNRYQASLHMLTLPVKLVVCVIGVFLISISTNYWVILSFVILCLTLLTVHEGIILDFEKKRLKLYIGLWGIKLGKWESMPTYCRLTLVQTTGNRRLHSKQAMRTYDYSEKSYELRLYDTGSHAYQIASKGTKSNVRKKAEQLSLVTHLAIEDFTEPH